VTAHLRLDRLLPVVAILRAPLIGLVVFAVGTRRVGPCYEGVDAAAGRGLAAAANAARVLQEGVAGVDGVGAEAEAVAEGRGALGLIACFP